jgi:hypothetical protein
MSPSYGENEAAKLAAALASAQARDNALLDTSLFNMNVKSRHLLSDYDYEEESHKNVPAAKTAKSPNKNSRSRRNVAPSAVSNRSNQAATNLTKQRQNDSMELVLINGTWHLINLSMCYNMMYGGENKLHTFQNYTHLNKYDNKLH